MSLISDLIDKKIIETNGHFVLKSGKVTDTYIDLRKTISYPDLHYKICLELSKKLNMYSNKPNLHICGAPYGAVSYVSNLSIMLNIPMLFLRKEQKQHGTKRQIEGTYSKGDQVIIIEDVVTTGESLNWTAKQLENAGLNVINIYSIISRSDKDVFYRNINVDSILNLNQIHKFSRDKIKQRSLDLKSIITEKQTKICFAADVSSLSELISILENVGDSICILKLHSEVIEDFYDNFSYTIETLKRLASKYNFLIWEDRKLADIGSIMQRQANHIKKWADIVSVVPIAGNEALDAIKDIGIIVISQLSSKNNLITAEYTNRILEMIKHNLSVIGIVSQNKLNSDKLHFVPGISFNSKSDGLGQQYDVPQNKQFADVFVIGRSIYLSEDPKKEIDKYKK